MKTEEIKDLFNKFESIVCDYNGVECWSARELYKLLGYVQWRNFLTIVEKAKSACENAGENINYHFADARKMIGKGPYTICQTRRIYKTVEKFTKYCLYPILSCLHLS